MFFGEVTISNAFGVVNLIFLSPLFYSFCVTSNVKVGSGIREGGGGEFLLPTCFKIVLNPSFSLFSNAAKEMFPAEKITIKSEVFVEVRQGQTHRQMFLFTSISPPLLGGGCRPSRRAHSKEKNGKHATKDKNRMSKSSQLWFCFPCIKLQRKTLSEISHNGSSSCSFSKGCSISVNNSLL